MKMKSIFVAAGLILSLGAQAGGATSQLITPTLWPIAPDVFACNLTNVSTKNRTVQLRIINEGNILFDSGKISVAPKHTANHVIDGLPKGGLVYCEFTVEGSKSWYRGVAKMFHGPSGSDFIAIAAE